MVTILLNYIRSETFAANVVLQNLCALCENKTPLNERNNIWSQLRSSSLHLRPAVSLWKDWQWYVPVHNLRRLVPFTASQGNFRICWLEQNRSCLQEMCHQAPLSDALFWQQVQHRSRKTSCRKKSLKQRRKMSSKLSSSTRFDDWIVFANARSVWICTKAVAFRSDLTDSLNNYVAPQSGVEKPKKTNDYRHKSVNQCC